MSTIDRYRSTDGRIIHIPARRPLPEYETDLSGLAEAIAQTLPEVTRTRLLTFKEDTKRFKSFIAEHSAAERKLSTEERRTCLSQLEKMERAIELAETQFADQANARIDSIVNCFESPASIQDFNITISKLLGYGFSTFANSRGKLVDEDHPWLKPLVGRLSPAHLTALTRSLRESELFGLNRDMKLFHEDALLAYLQSDYGDVRHLEHDITRDMARPSHHRPLQNAIDKGEGIKTYGRPVGEPVDLSAFWFYYDAYQLSGFPHLIKTYLGLDLHPDDISQSNHSIGDYIGYRVSGMLKSEQTSYRGYLLEHFIRNPKYSRLASAPNEALWPYIAENFQALDRALFGDLKPGTSTPKSSYGALQAIALLPAVPARYEEVLGHISKAGKKWEKSLALKLLSQT